MNAGFPEWGIDLAERWVEVECFFADVLKFVELTVLSEEASATRPV